MQRIGSPLSSQGLRDVALLVLRPGVTKGRNASLLGIMLSPDTLHARRNARNELILNIHRPPTRAVGGDRFPDRSHAFRRNELVFCRLQVERASPRLRSICHCASRISTPSAALASPASGFCAKRPSGSLVVRPTRLMSTRSGRIASNCEISKRPAWSPSWPSTSSGSARTKCSIGKASAEGAARLCGDRPGCRRHGRRSQQRPGSRHCETP